MNSISPAFHSIEQGTENAPAIFLLHGTGGSEHDLIPLVADFADSHRLIGLRGNIDEHGQQRFFKRQEDGTLDQESIRLEASKLAAHLEHWHATHNQDVKNTIYVGYSNGANMILSLLFLYPDLIHKAALLHPMLPFQPDATLDLSQKSIFLSWSESDQIIPKLQSQKLIETLTSLAPKLSIVQTDRGHSLTKSEVIALHTFIQSN